MGVLHGADRWLRDRYLTSYSGNRRSSRTPSHQCAPIIPHAILSDSLLNPPLYRVGIQSTEYGVRSTVLTIHRGSCLPTPCTFASFQRLSPCFLLGPSISAYLGTYYVPSDSATGLLGLPSQSSTLRYVPIPIFSPRTQGFVATPRPAAAISRC
jgi:hypothetical protein